MMPLPEQVSVADSDNTSTNRFALKGRIFG
jgi:hypothetical protein